MKSIRKIGKPLSVILGLIMVLELVLPTVALGLTSGPSQPEVQSFEPFNTTQMVDNFTGDMTYNIPLLDVGGYPVNLSYHSGINMDQEASWVGLGWNINPGTINRGMRGLPDDFKGDPLQVKQSTKPNVTVGGSLNFSVELFSLDVKKLNDLGKMVFRSSRKAFSLDLGIGLGLKYNNYRGMAADFSISPSISANIGAKSGLNVGLGLNSSTQNGVGFEPNISYSYKVGKFRNADNGDVALGVSVGASINSRSGLGQVSYGMSVKRIQEKVDKKVSFSNDQFNIDKKTSSSGSTLGGLSGSYNFAAPSYSPAGDFSYRTFGLSMNMTVGFEMFGTHGSIRGTGYFSKQYLHEKEINQPAYGLMYLQHAYDSEGSVMDFNREKEGAFIPSKPNLPVTQLTGDVYGVTGQGVSGSYLPFRGEVGWVSDPRATTRSDDASYGAEVGLGNLDRQGGNIAYSYFWGETGRWKKDNEFYDAFKYKDWDRDHINFEPYYFKGAGEASVSGGDDLYTRFGNDAPIRATLAGRKAVKAFNRSWNTYSEPFTENNVRPHRDRRNQTIQILTAEEASRWGLTKDIPYYKPDGTKASMSRVSQNRKGHHISEIIVTRTDGSRYVYGIAAYNLKQKEATFNIDKGTFDRCTETAQYETDDASVNNNKGIDHFYSEKNIPSYAYAYLLTAVLSPDYVDLTGDGPSTDDLGSATWFNYSQTSPAGDPFKWRTPYPSTYSRQALYNEGLLSDPTDDKASYVYGEKEIWYLHSVETKTHRAQFHLSTRQDGKGVAGEHIGMAGSLQSYKLDSISLYARAQDPMSSRLQDLPLKTVHMEYDYSLCKETHNSSATGGGKLTLKKVCFTYGNTSKDRGKLNPYTFVYSSVNPNYNLKGTDRWGDYKPAAPVEMNGVLRQRNSYFPYTEQDADSAAKYTSAWCLKTVKLPSGGKIDIDYESDDYAYVQDKKAMMMFKVVGACDHPKTEPAYSALYTDHRSAYKYLVFDLLPEHRSSTLTEVNDEFIRKRYIGNIEWLYFKFLVRTGKNHTYDHPVYDYVSGYAKIEPPSCGVTDYGGIKRGFVKLRLVDFSERNADGNMNPITKAALNFGQLVTPKYMYRGFDTYDESNEFVAGIKQIATSVTQIGELFTGLESKFLGNEFGRQFEPSNSCIRLHHPTGYKMGGGLRVKRITMSDRWNEMTGQPLRNEQSRYGFEYDYRIADDADTTRLISSGVATYEPMTGNDENPWRQIIGPYGENNPLAADGEQFMETPMGESHFPAPSVGYRQIRVTPFGTSTINNASTTRHGGGSMEYEFYTAKDFPVFLHETELKQERSNNRPILSLLKVGVKDKTAVSQGYTIITNDMHGKPRSERSYAEGRKVPLSEKRYVYQTSREVPGRLNNTVLTLGQDGSTALMTLGQDVSIVMDMNESDNETWGPGLELNVDGFIIPSLPPLYAKIPIIMPSLNTEVTGFRSAVVTKVVQQYGVLMKTIVSQEGVDIISENLLWDRETGAVLLTRTQNEFEDWVYQFSYPAHWAYEGMGQAYRNIGARVRISTHASGIISGGTGGAFFPGDELGMENEGYEKLWVTRKSFSGVDTLMVIDAEGKPAGNLMNRPATILRSGRRNMAATPIGTVTLLQNPLNEAGTAFNPAFAKVLDAQATRFREDWSVFCCNQGLYIGSRCNAPCEVFNPYVQGRLGNWRAYQSYKYVTDRDFDHPVSVTRAGGTLKNFSSFWLKDSEHHWQPPADVDQASCRWVSGSEVTLVNQYGAELENRDALGRYTAAQFGYNNTLPVAVAQNARYRELGYEGFEDKSWGGLQGQCRIRDHYRMPIDFLSEGVAHTGRYSVRILSGQMLSAFHLVDGTACSPPAGLQTPATINECRDCIPTLRLDRDSDTLLTNNYDAHKNKHAYRYSLSVWSKTVLPDTTCQLNGARVKVYALTDCKAVELYSFSPTGARIEGWKKIEGDFTAPSHVMVSGELKEVVGLRVDWVADPTAVTYFDDYRVHPYHATMKTFVYDPMNLRLAAELDENNYATFYEYDAAGALVRVKKETERGVMTLREHRSHGTYINR